MTIHNRLNLGLAFLLVVVGAIACHADADDPAGQAEELSDPVRRNYAITNLTRLYTTALGNNDGNREAGPVKSIADTIHDELTRCYLDHPEDTQNGLLILELMKEMQDPRTIPALIEATEWREGVTEEHAIRAADTIRATRVPDGDKERVIAAVSAALDRVVGVRGEDNRMRIAFIRALRAMEDRRTAPILTKVMTTQSEQQNFLINRMAGMALARLGDPEAVPAFIKALFLFAPGNPAMQMDDIAINGLVRIGRPALAPLVETLGGRNEEASQLATAYIEAIRQRDANAAEHMSVGQVVSGQSTAALGSLGFREALAPLVAETQQQDPFRMVNAAVAIVQLNLSDEDRTQVSETLRRVYTTLGTLAATENPDSLPEVQRVPRRNLWQAQLQLVAAMRQLYDGSFMTFFLDQVRNHEVPDIRIESVNAYSVLANAAEAEALRTYVTGLPEDDGMRDIFLRNDAQENEPMWAAAAQCNEELACWVGKLNEAGTNTNLARKAAFMIGRLGRGNQQAIDALVTKLDHMEIQIRFACIAALDRIATSGAPAAVQKIDQMAETEEGRRIWDTFSRQALPIQARLIARTQ
jgi:HEAT repeat protein